MAGDCKRNAGFQKQLNAFLWNEFSSLLKLAMNVLGKMRTLRKGATMIDPMIGTSTCTLCNATCASETKLHEHQRMAHRGRGNEERPKAAVVAEQSKDTGNKLNRIASSSK